MEMGGIFFKNLELYPPPPPPTIRFGRVMNLVLGSKGNMKQPRMAKAKLVQKKNAYMLHFEAKG